MQDNFSLMVRRGKTLIWGFKKESKLEAYPLVIPRMEEVEPYCMLIWEQGLEDNDDDECCVSVSQRVERN
jgi:hypothetical protein